MDVSYIVLWFFKILGITSVFMVIHSINPVQAVLFLILVFCNAAGIILLLKAEFLSMVFVVVYVGAIAVLFLFVVMMLNIKIAELPGLVFGYLPLGGLLAGCVAAQLSYIIYNSFSTFSMELVYNDWADVVNSLSNIEVLGVLIYTYYYDSFLLGSMILLVAMIGAIVLTLAFGTLVDRQDIFTQVKRKVNDSVVLKSF